MRGIMLCLTMYLLSNTTAAIFLSFSADVDTSVCLLCV